MAEPNPSAAGPVAAIPPAALDEMGFAWPWSWTPAIMEGLEGTHRGGVRYPVPSFLRYTGEYPETYERLKAMWKENA